VSRFFRRVWSGGLHRQGFDDFLNNRFAGLRVIALEQFFIERFQKYPDDRIGGIDYRQHKGPRVGLGYHLHGIGDNGSHGGIVILFQIDTDVPPENDTRYNLTKGGNKW
jgi:hypothetical protein